MKKKKRQVIDYYDNCKRCGNEFKLPSKNAIRICPKCRPVVDKEKAKEEVNRRIQEANAEATPLIGATVVGINFVSTWLPDSSEFSEILLKTSEGKIIRLYAMGYEDQHITWEDAEEKDLEEMHIK